VKNVLDIVSYKYLPYNSGGQKCIALFLEYLGFRTKLHVASTSDNDIQLVKNYTLHPLLRKGKIKYVDLTALFRIRNFINKHHINTLIIEQPFIGWLGVVLKFITGVKLIIRSHNIEYERFRTLGKPWWFLLKVYESWVLRNADIVFCISDEDKLWMHTKMGINPNKSITIPYGINQDSLPEDKKNCKEQVCHIHGLDPNSKLLFFNGLLSYPPNADALRNIILKINPLLQEKGLKYNILIAGNGLPNEFEELKSNQHQNMYYIGFVEDIDLYTKAADVFLNPVNTGGGVKTKMIEALGMNTTVISTINGSMGVDKSVCGDKLNVVKNDDWEGFATAIINVSQRNIMPIPDNFYETYSWSAIANKGIPYLN
jgi:glycosyltransferase involved in cell wall biosynthesis